MNLRATSTVSGEKSLVDEKSLVKLYMELTGATESRARSVFMYVCCHPKEITPATQDFVPDAMTRRRRWQPLATDFPNAGWMGRRATCLASNQAESRIDYG